MIGADDVRDVRLRKAPLGRRGYDQAQVDAFLGRVEGDLRARQAAGDGFVRVGLVAADVREVVFGRAPFGKRGYDEEEVDALLSEIEQTVAALDQALRERGATVTKG